MTNTPISNDDLLKFLRMNEINSQKASQVDRMLTPNERKMLVWFYALQTRFERIAVIDDPQALAEEGAEMCQKLIDDMLGRRATTNG